LSTNPMAGSSFITNRLRTKSKHAKDQVQERAVSFAIKERGFGRMTERTKKRVNAVMTQHGADTLYSMVSHRPEEGKRKDNDNHNRNDNHNGKSLLHRSKVLDVLLAVLCLRAYPRRPGCCANKVCLLIVPSCFVLLSLVLWYVMISFSMEWSPAETPNRTGVVLWVVCAIGHLISTLIVLRASHSGITEKHYFLYMDHLDTVERRTDRSMLKWFSVIGTICIVLESMCIFALVPNIDAGEHSGHLAAISFFILILLILHPQVIVNGLLEARVQDLLDNTKMLYVLMEHCLDRPSIDLDHCFGMLAGVKKLG